MLPACPTTRERRGGGFLGRKDNDDLKSEGGKIRLFREKEKKIECPVDTNSKMRSKRMNNKDLTPSRRGNVIKRREAQRMRGKEGRGKRPGQLQRKSHILYLVSERMVRSDTSRCRKMNRAHAILSPKSLSLGFS